VTRSLPRRSDVPAPCRLLLPATLLGLADSACAAPGAPAGSTTENRSWSQITDQAKGQTVDLWMYGGDQQGNACVDDVLTPAAAKLGVTLRRVPVRRVTVADTKDAMTRILVERQAGKQAHAWRCGWSSQLANMKFVASDDALVTQDFGTDLDGCQAPWHKAQFTLATTRRGSQSRRRRCRVSFWAKDHPGRFTYPAPPDFTGSVFIREALDSTSGGYAQIPAQFDQGAYDKLTPKLWDVLKDVAPSLWRPRADLPPATRWPWTGSMPTVRST